MILLTHIMRSSACMLTITNMTNARVLVAKAEKLYVVSVLGEIISRIA